MIYYSNFSSPENNIRTLKRQNTVYSDSESVYADEYLTNTYSPGLSTITEDSTICHNDTADKMSINKENFADCLLGALQLEPIKAEFREILSPLVGKKFKETDVKVEKLEKVVTDQKWKINQLEMQMDQQEQDRKYNQAVITGIKAVDDQEKNKTSLINFFEENMSTTVVKEDIISAHGLTKQGQPMLVTFLNSNIRDIIFKKKKMLKDNEINVYINENLTKKLRCSARPDNYPKIKRFTQPGLSKET